MRLRKENKMSKLKQKISDEENILLEIKLHQKQRKQAKELQKNFDFSIPSYILSEMRKDNQNVFALINLAIINNRISKENADILKERLR